MEKVRGVELLPLFPLPLVLLPNEFLPLHIFESRYRQLLEDIENGNKLFGVTFFDPPESFIEKPRIETVGCAAEVREVHPLPDATSNILTIGLVRYRLLEYVETDEQYLVGRVEFFEDSREDKRRLKPLARDVFQLFERTAKAAFKLSGSRGKFPEIPQTEPEPLSFMITTAFNLENDLKYRMLETTSTIERLKKLREILSQAVVKMEESAEIFKIAQMNGHSQKKIDL